MGSEGFPHFSSLFFAFLRFFVFLHFSSFFIVFLRFSPILPGKEQTTAVYWENGEFHSDPVCTDPVQNFPINLGGGPPANTVKQVASDTPPPKFRG